MTGPPIPELINTINNLSEDDKALLFSHLQLNNPNNQQIDSSSAKASSPTPTRTEIISLVDELFNEANQFDQAIGDGIKREIKARLSILVGMGSATAHASMPKNVSVILVKKKCDAQTDDDGSMDGQTSELPKKRGLPKESVTSVTKVKKEYSAATDEESVNEMTAKFTEDQQFTKQSAPAATAAIKKEYVVQTDDDESYEPKTKKQCISKQSAVAPEVKKEYDVPTDEEEPSEKDIIREEIAGAVPVVRREYFIPSDDESNDDMLQSSKKQSFPKENGESNNVNQSSTSTEPKTNQHIPNVLPALQKGAADSNSHPGGSTRSINPEQTEGYEDNNDTYQSGDVEQSNRGSFITMSTFGGMRLYMPPPPPLITPPSNLPDPKNLLQFDVNEKKHEIFEAARERIRNKAQYTKSVSFEL